MKNILFNSHDLVLALVIGLSFLLAIRTISSPNLQPAPRKLLVMFFVLTAFSAMDTLLFWGDAIRYAAFELSPWLLMLFSFAAFIMGPTLYWVFRSWNSSNFSLTPTDYLQLLPVLATPIYLYWVCYRHPLEEQRELILGLSIFSNPDANFMAFLTLKKLSPVIYGIFCVRLILRSSPHLIPANAQRFHLYSGFVYIWFWVLLTHMLGQWLPLGASDLMGIFGNYANLTLITALLFKDIQNRSIAASSYATPEVEVEEDNDSVELAALAKRIHEFVVVEKPYLNSQLTLERFAALLFISPRQVSMAINRCFEQNFHEYINRHRVVEAERLLRDTQCQNYTIADIAQHAGFNSKATFNRYFKLLVGVTPSAYRGGQQPPTELEQHNTHD